MIKRIKNYLKEVRIEWSKVTKPAWSEVQGRTGVVLAGTAVLAAFLWIVDLIVGYLIRIII
jgi:preprotein translocase SecE subunit